MSLVDSYGRDVDYLRISIADTCNLKCRYCSPSFSGRSHVDRAEILFYEEFDHRGDSTMHPAMLKRIDKS